MGLGWHHMDAEVSSNESSGPPVRRDGLRFSPTKNHSYGRQRRLAKRVLRHLGLGWDELDPACIGSDRPEQFRRCIRFAPTPNRSLWWPQRWRLFGGHVDLRRDKLDIRYACGQPTDPAPG